ncbi:MAG TPA: 3-oxoacyl-[acyl-carrier-protein] reductase [Planctomycetes bacterium]|nr:3-oxoacyl-[acyl-carrier-protein] reductase [Planctomycetota bacterium]
MVRDDALKGKWALVTGSARGIGRRIAEVLAARGAAVVVADVVADAAAQTAQAIRDEAGVEVLSYGMDVTSEESVKGLFEELQKKTGGPDVLVNNAGITRDGLLMRMDAGDWDAVLNVNLKGAFLCTKHAVRPMMKKRSGRIVNVASIIGMMGNAGQSNYAASKGGLIAFTKSIAKEVAPRGINVNAVAPGYIRTAMTEALAEDVRARMLELIPLGRLGEVDDVADAVSFLAGPESSFITGQVLRICGGMLM